MTSRFFELTKGLTTIGRSELLSDWHAVKPGDKLHLYSSADIILNIFVEFNYSANEPPEGHRLSFKKISVLNRQYKADIVKAEAPFCRFRVVNNTGNENHFLHVFCYLESKDEPKPPNIYVPEVPRDLPHEEERFSFDGEAKPRSSTPGRLRNFMTKKADKETRMKTVDDRLPGYIPKNSLLVGGANGKVVTLPPGLPGQCLRWTETGLEWCFEYPPRG